MGPPNRRGRVRAFIGLGRHGAEVQTRKAREERESPNFNGRVSIEGTKNIPPPISDDPMLTRYLKDGGKDSLDDPPEHTIPRFVDLGMDDEL